MGNNVKVATIVGYHGYRNFGDDIFLEIVVNWLHTSLDVKKCFVMEKVAGVARKVDGVNVIPFSNSIARISRLAWILIFLNAKKSDLLVFSAGSIFTIQPFFLMYLVLLLLRLLRGNRLQILAVGVSIGPFSNNFDKYWCGRSLALMNHVLLRDSHSVAQIERMNKKIEASLSYDLALSWYDKVCCRNIVKDRKIIGVALTKRGFGQCEEEHSEICNSIVDALDKIAVSSALVELRLFNVCGDQADGDYHICEHLLGRLSRWKERIEIVSYENVDIYGMVESLSECSAVVAARMHAGIMASLSAVPVLQISYSEKIRNYYLNSGLSEEYLFDNEEVSEPTVEHFLVDALSGELRDHAVRQREVLENKGKQLKAALVRLAEMTKSHVD